MTIQDFLNTINKLSINLGDLIFEYYEDDSPKPIDEDWLDEHDEEFCNTYTYLSSYVDTNDGTFKVYVTTKK